MFDLLSKIQAARRPFYILLCFFLLILGGVSGISCQNRSVKRFTLQPQVQSANLLYLVICLCSIILGCFASFHCLISCHPQSRGHTNIANIKSSPRSHWELNCRSVDLQAGKEEQRSRIEGRAALLPLTAGVPIPFLLEHVLTPAWLQTTR